MARGFGPNLASLFGAPAGDAWGRLPLGGAASADLLAVVLIAAVAALLCGGLRQSARAQASLMALNLAVIDD